MSAVDSPDHPFGVLENAMFGLNAFPTKLNFLMYWGIMLASTVKQDIVRSVR